MARSGSPSQYAILEESPSEDDSTSTKGERSSLPLHRACNVVVFVVPIMTTLPPEETLVPQTILARPEQTAIATPLLKQLMTHKEGR
jgi:hypothetical protein